MSSNPSDVGAAAARLERALSALETRLRQSRARASTEGDLFADQGTANLAEDLEAARAREAALEKAATEASLALGRAASEVRALLEGGA